MSEVDFDSFDRYGSKSDWGTSDKILLGVDLTKPPDRPDKNFCTHCKELIDDYAIWNETEIYHAECLVKIGKAKRI